MAKVPRLFLLYCNALYDAATLFFMSFWEIVPSFSAIFVLTISFAVTDGFLNTIPTSKTLFICFALMYLHTYRLSR